jgi:hypothetical protein
MARVDRRDKYRVPPEQRERGWITPFIDTLGRRERKGWKSAELRHLIAGYKFAAESLGVPEEAQPESIRALLRITSRYSKPGLVKAFISSAIRKRSRLPPQTSLMSLMRLQDRFRKNLGYSGIHVPGSGILVDSDDPAALGYVSANVGAYYLQPGMGLSGNRAPMVIAFDYTNPSRKRTGVIPLKRMTRRRLETVPKKASSAPRLWRTASQLKEGRIPFIAVGVADSLRARLGDEVADRFLRLVITGVHPREAYRQAVGK